MREQDSRVNDGILVDLLWFERAGRVWVTVTDTRTGGSFALPVGDDECALDVFHHPYAYAAAHGVATTSGPVDSDTTLAA